MSPRLRSAFLASALALTGCFNPTGAAPRTWSEDLIHPVTGATVGKLPKAERAPWEAYLAESAKRKALRAATPVGPAPKSATTTSVKSGNLRLTEKADYYASPEAVALAGRVLSWQLPEGGWPKGANYADLRPADAPLPKGTWSFGTFDNKTTTPELRFIALVAHALGNSPEAKPLRTGIARGVGYLFAAQYPNGGFPQIYPLVGDYHDAVTFNDGAMVNVLALLRDIAAPTSEFAFVPAEIRADAAARLERGVACLLAAQVKIDGTPAVWPQQVDALTLAPAPARAFEPIALSASESAGIVDFLSKLPPTPAITASITSALAWFERTALRDVVWKADGDAGHRLVPTAGAPLLWARFYDIGTNKPVFGDRDFSIHDDVNELSAERRSGYSWFGSYAAKLLARKPAK